MSYAEGSHPQILQKDHLFNQGRKSMSGHLKKGIPLIFFTVLISKLNSL